jgi:hypothetical protein
MGSRRPASALLLAALVVLVAGCGSSGEGTEPETAAGPANGAATEQGHPPASKAPPGVRARECGGSIRATGVDCATARAVAAEWESAESCRPKAGASRFACTVGPYRCIGAVSDQGRAVFCARPGRSIVFVANR